jgi:hypothetical protein
MTTMVDSIVRGRGGGAPLIGAPPIKDVGTGTDGDRLPRRALGDD